jgi:hypothetical protein
VDAVTVVDLGTEQGGLTICGRQQDGMWSFRSNGQSIALDDNDDQEWRQWTTKPVADLNSLLPTEWPMFLPIKIHPGFREWFRERYTTARGVLPGHPKRSQARHQGREWQRLLGD